MAKERERGIKTFKEMCEEAKVNYPNALYQRKKHPSLSNDEVIQICCIGKTKGNLTEEQKALYYADKSKPFMVKCKENNIDYAMAYMYLHRHPDMSEDEVITYYQLKATNRSVTKNIAMGVTELKKLYPDLSMEELVAYCLVITIHPTFTKEDVKRYYELKGMYPNKTDKELVTLM